MITSRIWKALCKLRILWILGTFGLCWSSPASAKDFFFTAAIPAHFAFNQTVSLGGNDLDTKTPTGFYLNVRLANGWGWGAGRYFIDFEGLDTYNLRYDLWNLSYQFTIAKFGVGIGYGMGLVKMNCPWCNNESQGGSGASTSNEGSLTERSLLLSIPLGDSWKIALGYHQIDAEMTFTQEGSDGSKNKFGPLNLNGTMISLGATLKM